MWVFLWDVRLGVTWPIVHSHSRLIFFVNYDELWRTMINWLKQTSCLGWPASFPNRHPFDPGNAKPHRSVASPAPPWALWWVPGCALTRSPTAASDSTARIHTPRTWATGQAEHVENFKKNAKHEIHRRFPVMFPIVRGFQGKFWWQIWDASNMSSTGEAYDRITMYRLNREERWQKTSSNLAPAAFCQCIPFSRVLLWGTRSPCEEKGHCASLGSQRTPSIAKNHLSSQQALALDGTCDCFRKCPPQ